MSLAEFETLPDNMKTRVLAERVIKEWEDDPENQLEGSEKTESVLMAEIYLGEENEPPS